MGYIISFLKKVLGAREVITVLLTTLQIALFAALAVFIFQLTSALFDLYQLILQLFNMTTSGTLAGSAGGNNFNVVAWSMLDAYGILDVFLTFLPLIFSTLTFYFSLLATRILLDFKQKLIKNLYFTSHVFLG